MKNGVNSKARSVSSGARWKNNTPHAGTDEELLEFGIRTEPQEKTDQCAKDPAKGALLRLHRPSDGGEKPKGVHHPLERP